MAKKPTSKPAKATAKKSPAGRKKRPVPLVKNGERVPKDLIDPDFLTEGEMMRRERFAQAYVIHGTLAKSVRTAGFEVASDNSATVIGHRLYKEPWVQARIKEIQQQKLHALGVTSDRVMLELTRIALLDPEQIMDDLGVRALHLIPEDARRAVASYKSKRRIIPGHEGEPDIEEEEREVRFVSKDAALDKLARIIGMYEKEKEDKGLTAESFARALGEGIARAANRAR